MYSHPGQPRQAEEACAAWPSCAFGRDPGERAATWNRELWNQDWGAKMGEGKNPHPPAPGLWARWPKAGWEFPKPQPRTPGPRRGSGRRMLPAQPPWGLGKACVAAVLSLF